jgi:DNA mismatch repair protein MutL
MSFMEPNSNRSSKPVKRLDDQVAKKIAAGEVIERPASVVRELLDNAIDSNATTINLSLISGGLDSIEVTDNGFGMTKEDLELCWLSHATSKITHEDDLLSIQSLGFRGEALASIAAVSRTTILSSQHGSKDGNKLQIENSRLISLEPAAWDRGTKVQVSDLFYNLPARKKFLKRPSAESTQCKTIFLEKALAFPELDFQFTNDGGSQIRLLPQKGDRKQLHRVLDCFPNLGKPQVFWELTGSGTGFTFQIVLGDPELFRRDKRYIQIFVNNRRIQEYSLVQALDYGTQGFFHGGTYPIAFLFLQVEPNQIDFNIHPAKREAKFLHLQEIHHRVSRTVQDHLTRSAKKQFGIPHFNQESNPGFSYITKSPNSTGSDLFGRTITTGATSDLSSISRNIGSRNNGPFQQSNTSYFESANKDKTKHVFDLSIRYNPDHQDPIPATTTDQEQPKQDYTYLGLAFNLFLLVQTENRILFIDMHAAHEKILFNNHKLNPNPQPLLIPIQIQLDSNSGFSSELFESLKPLGFDGSIQLIPNEELTIEITKVPGALQGKEQLIHDFFLGFEGNREDLERRLYSTMSCRAAIMQGDFLEPSAARFIIEQTLSMEDPRCPHGRPLWFELTKEDLFTWIGRD